MAANRPAAPTVPVYDWLSPAGKWIGCGTIIEMEHWIEEGTLDADTVVGATIAREPASADERRRRAWARQGSA